MKPNQRILYAERIERVIEFLEAADLEEGPVPSLEALAQVAAMSPYHFHRIFRLMTGETVGEAVRRVRLARAVPALAAGASVTAATGASGYGSSQSFARSLAANGSGTAARMRVDPAYLDQVAARLSAPARDGEQSFPLTVTITSLQPFRLLAMRNVGDYAELNGGYARLFELVLEQVAPDQLLGIYGVPHDDPRFTPAGECRFDCALAVGTAGTATGALKELELGGGEYLTLRHLGDYDRVHDAIDLAYVSALAEHGREIGESPLFIHYLDDPEEVAEAALRADIFLPLA